MGTAATEDRSDLAMALYDHASDYASKSKLLVLAVLLCRYYRAISRALFGGMLLGNMSLAVLLIKLLNFLPLATNTKQGWCLWLTQFAWRLSLACAPWIRTHTTSRSKGAWADYLQDEEVKESPAFILSNHVSFLDTILTVSNIPQSTLFNTRCYMGSHLYKLPLLGAICKAAGHFPVHFASSTSGNFKVDKEKMKQVEIDVTKHVDAGGVLALYPEGQMNGNPAGGLLPFRYGAFRRALDCDARLWALVTVGHDLVWPRKAQVGGFPAKTGLDFQPVAPNGVRALVKDIRAEINDERPDHVLLAEHVHAMMQTQHNYLSSNH